MALTKTPYATGEVGGTDQANRNVSSNRETIIQNAPMPPATSGPSNTLTPPNVPLGEYQKIRKPPVLNSEDIMQSKQVAPQHKTGNMSIEQGGAIAREEIARRNGTPKQLLTGEQQTGQIITETPEVPTNTGNQGLGEAPTYPENKPTDNTELKSVGTGPSPEYVNKKGQLTTEVSPLGTDPVAEAKKQLEEEKKIKEQEAEKVRKETIDKINAETKTKDQQIAEEKGYTFQKNKDGSITFSPKDLDEAIDIYTTFGKGSKIDKFSKNAIVGSKVYENYYQYKGATADVYLQGFRTNDIGTSGGTWDQLVKMNGGQPTAEMLKAQEQWEQETKTSNVNSTIKTGAGETLTTTTETLNTNLTKLDTAYNDFISKSFEGLEANYKTYKAGNEKMTTLNDSLTSTASEIDELEVAKRRVMDDVRKRYPTLPLSQQLAIADQDLDAIDDQLFVKQRKYNSDLATYKFEDEKNRADFEYNTKIAEQKMGMAEKLYGIQRGDIIRREDIDRADKQLADSIARAKQDKLDAIANGDKEAARDQAYKIALMEEEAKINKENKANFQGFSVTGGIMSYDSETGTAKFIPAGESGGGTGTSGYQDTTIGTYTLPNGKEITSTGGLANGLSNILSENPDIQIDYQNLYRSSVDQQKLYGKGRTAEELVAAGVPAEYADPTSKISTWTLDSNHMKGNAVDVVVPKGQDKVAYINSIESTMNQNGFYRPTETVKAGDYGHFEYRGNGNNGNIPAKQAKTVDDLPIAFKNQVKNKIPGFDRNSDTEKESIIKDTITLYNRGLSGEQAALEVMGFDTNNLNQNNAQKYIDVGVKLGKYLPDGYAANVSNFLSKGDTESLNDYVQNSVEDAVIGKYGDKTITTPDMQQGLDDTKQIKDLINKSKDEIGLFSGTITDLQKKFGEDNKDIQNLQTLLTAYQANIRHTFAGSNVTEPELKALENYVGGSIKMSPNNLITLIDTVTNRSKRLYDGQRKSIGFNILDGGLTNKIETPNPIPTKQTSFQKIQSNTSSMPDDNVYEEFDTSINYSPYNKPTYKVSGFNY